MQEFWITRGSQASQKLIVVALGWAGEPSLVEHLDTGGADLLCLYDWRDLTASPELLSRINGYRAKHLVAWSFGVWAAPHLFSVPGSGSGTDGTERQSIAWNSAAAINGTPWGIHPQYGIPPRTFNLTLRGLEAGGGILKFLERMCGDCLTHYMRHRSRRPLAEIIEELSAIGRRIPPGEETVPTALPWSRAIVGEKDLIFPPAAMVACWQRSGVSVEQRPDMPHYPFYDPAILIDATR